MKLSVFSPVLADMDLDSALSYLNELGVYSMELGCGGFPGTAHADAGLLVGDARRLEALQETFARHHTEICALSTHANPVHPNKEIAEQAQRDFENTCLLAEKLGIETVITFSGCPGDCDDSRHPNWVTCPWPDDFGEVLDYQWNEKLIPYWKNACAFAGAHGVSRIALEMHPGFCVYNPETLLRLRNAAGKMIGANFDPSHLIWQGIDPQAALFHLDDAIYHFHAKDTKINKRQCGINGVLDTKHYTKERERSWIFRTVGYGLAAETWKEMMSALSTMNYPYAVSIEHEDSLMTSHEGLEKAVAFMQDVMIKNSKPGSIRWA